MIRIDRLSLNLPAKMRHRSRAITHHIGESLAEMNIEHSARIESLPKIETQYSPHRSDRSIGQDIARAIVKSARASGGPSDG